MRVLQINSVCGIGSTGRIATDIHAILNEQGHESYIAFGRENAMNCDNTIKIGKKFDNYSHVVKTRIFDKHGFGSKRATKKFITKIKNLDPDVIHLHNIHGYYINVEILFEYLKEANKPVIWTLHDCWPFTGHCTYFDFVGCDCWRIDGSHKCIQKRSYPASLLFNNSRDNFKRKKMAFTRVKNLTVVTPSKWLANLVKESFLSEYTTRVINNGINLDTFKITKSDFRKKYNIGNKIIALGVASEWDTRKGLSDFIKLSEIIDDNIQIVLVGLTEKQKKQISSKVICIGKTNSTKELAEIYTAADVFINPTYEDNFPTTNLEALACGTPVITYDTGGSVESIDPSCGIVVKKGSYTDIAKILSEETFSNLLASNCINRSERFNKDLSFTKYQELYQNLGNKF